MFLLFSAAMFANFIEINPDAVKNDPAIEKARATRFQAIPSFSTTLIDLFKFKLEMYNRILLYCRFIISNL